MTPGRGTMEVVADPAQKGPAMFLHLCSACHRRQLIFPSQVTAVAAGAGGPVASFTCWCGAEQSAPYSLAPSPATPTAGAAGSDVAQQRALVA